MEGRVEMISKIVVKTLSLNSDYPYHLVVGLQIDAIFLYAALICLPYQTCHIRNQVITGNRLKIIVPGNLWVPKNLKIRIGIVKVDVSHTKFHGYYLHYT